MKTKKGLFYELQITRHSSGDRRVSDVWYEEGRGKVFIRRRREPIFYPPLWARLDRFKRDSLCRA